MTESIGIIGVGAIAEAITFGLSTGEDPPTIMLSPRNAKITHTLASEHQNVHVCESNQAVVDASAVVLLTVRPDHVEKVLGELRVPGDRVLISAVAGWSCAALGDLLGDGPSVVRSVPLPAVRERRGVTALFPQDPVAGELFNGLGGTVLAPDEESFSGLSAATATISSYLHYLATIAGWLKHQGFQDQAADSFVRSMFLGANTSLEDDEQSLTQLSAGHETPHGINEELRTTWFDQENSAALQAALDQIFRRVSANLPKTRDIG